MPEAKRQTTLQWAGLDLEIRFTKNWLNATAYHVEAYASGPVSVTATSYRSHYLPAQMDLNLDLVLGFLIGWLEDALQAASEQDPQEPAIMGGLFDL